MSGETPILVARGLAVAAGGTVLFEGLSFTARAGDIWAIVGPNGAGKTTLMRTLAGFAPPAQGEVRLAGSAYRELLPAARARLRAWLPQDDRDAFAASVAETVLAARHPYATWRSFEAEADLAAADAAMRALGVQGLAARDVRTLSGGERRRVALAELCAQDTPLLLVDEPSAHLDVAQQVAALDALAAMVRERHCALLMVLHDLTLAARYADHAILVGSGRAEAGAASTLLDAQRLSTLFGRPLAELGEGRVRAFVPR